MHIAINVSGVSNLNTPQTDSIIAKEAFWITVF